MYFYFHTKLHKKHHNFTIPRKTFLPNKKGIFKKNDCAKVKVQVQQQSKKYKVKVWKKSESKVKSTKLILLLYTFTLHIPDVKINAEGSRDMS